MTAELAARVSARIRAVHDRLRAEGGPVDLASLWFAAMGALHEGALADVDDVRRELQRRWAEILGPCDGGHVRLGHREVADGVAARFPARGVGWDAAHYISPDVMLLVDGPEAARDGAVELVLGELHVAANTLGSSLFVHQHPDPEQLLAATARDHPGPRLVPLPAKEHRLGSPDERGRHTGATTSAGFLMQVVRRSAAPDRGLVVHVRRVNVPHTSTSIADSEPAWAVVVAEVAVGHGCSVAETQHRDRLVVVLVPDDTSCSLVAGVESGIGIIVVVRAARGGGSGTGSRERDARHSAKNGRDRGECRTQAGKREPDSHSDILTGRGLGSGLLMFGSSANLSSGDW